MKKAILIIILPFLLSINSFSQENDTTSIIFPLSGKPIKNCQIIAVDSVNLITYSNRSDTLIVVAKAYIKNGEVFSLFNLPGAIKEFTAPSQIMKTKLLTVEESKDYLYHENLYYKHKKQSRIGIPFLGAGVLFLTSGLGIYYSGNDIVEYYANDKKAPAIFLMVIGGSSLVVGGIIIGINSSMAIENKKETHEIKNNNISLNIGIQRNGVGISLRF